MATHSNGIAALQLQAQLGLGSYKSAWLMCAKLRRAPLAGLVEMVLKPLVRRQATRLSHDRFKADSDRLIRALKQVLTDAETVRRQDELRREARQQAPSPAHTSAGFPHIRTCAREDRTG